jgi:hypothetical protein
MPRKRVLARTFPLSDADWHEIWNSGDEGIQNKLPVDGFGTTGAIQRRLSETDWIQIYLSVGDKREALKRGVYGRDRMARKWRVHLDSILEALSPIREHLAGVEQTRRIRIVR